MKTVLWLLALLGLVQAGAAERLMVAGQVRLSDGQPVAGAQVALFDLTDLRAGAVARATTDAAGAFALSGLGGRTLPDGFALGPNYPNPFNPSTLIPYQLPGATHVRLEVFNVLGQRVTTLVDGERSAGFHTAVWDATNAAGQAVGAGVYFYRLSSRDALLTRKMVLIDGQAGRPAVPGGSGRPLAERPLGADAPVYGLTVWGSGLEAYVDPAFAVQAGMVPVEVEVAAPARGKRLPGSGLLGDVDGEGRVDVVDALFVAMYHVDSSSLSASLSNIALGDVNGDGQIDFVDAYLIGTYSTNPSDPVLPAGIGQKPTVSGEPKMYWADWSRQKIQRANLDGSQVETLVSDGWGFRGLERPHSLALDVGQGKMYWADGNASRIQRANLDGSQVETLVSAVDVDQNLRSPVTFGTDNSPFTFFLGFRSPFETEDNSMHPVGIALDVGQGKMYWTDANWDMILRANLDGSQVEPLVTTGLKRPVGIALDVGRGKMYWTDRGEGTSDISRANLDGSQRETLVSSVVLPHHLALDVGQGKMYWTDYGTDKISRANLDGSQRETLVSTGLVTPTGLTLDVGRGKMYWADQGNRGRSKVKIQRANLNGSQVETVVSIGWGRPFGLALDTSGAGSGGGATSLTLGSSLAGRIATRDEVDYFRVDVRGPGVLTVYTTGGLNTTGTLQNSASDSLATDDDGGSGDNFHIEHLVTPGTYFVKVEGVGSNTGDYTIHARVEAVAVGHSHRSGATRLPLGSSRLGRIATLDDVNYFKVQVREFGVLTIYTTDDVFSNRGGTKGTLEDSSGSHLATRSGGNFRIEHLVTPGTYYVKVGGTTYYFDYIIHASFEAVDHSDLPLGGSLAGQIATRDDVDYFEVEISEAGVLTVYTTGGLNTRGTLQNSSSLATDDNGGSGDNFRIERFVTPGIYVVKVEGVGSNTGAYTIHARFEADDHSDTRSGATSLSLGGSLPGQIETDDDVDYFEVEVSQAGMLTVYSTGDLNTRGTLQNRSSSSLATDDNGGSGDNFRIEHSVSAGTYYVKVEGVGSNTGDYTVHVSFADDHSDTRSGATSLSLGGSLPGQIGTDDDVDYFKVEVSGAGVLTVYFTDSRGIACRLENSAGSSLGTNASVGRRDFGIARTVRTGTYYVRVKGHRSNTGAYTIHARFEADDHSDTRSGATSLSLGSSIAGRIANRDDVDCFKVEVSQAGVLTVYTTGSLNTEGRLEHSDGSYLESDVSSGSGDNFRIARAVRAGTYYVKVEGWASRTGDYTVHALLGADDHSDTRSGATSLPLGGSLAGQIVSRSDVDYFKVEVSQAGVLTIYSTGWYKTNGTLENSDGSYLDSDGSRFSFNRNFHIQRTVSPGTYYVKVVGRVFDAGAYTVHARFEADDQTDDHSNTRSGATSLSLGSSLPGRIGSGDDVDYFKVEVSEAGVLTVYTTGSLDTKGKLENSDGSSLATDDDGGSRNNFHIQRTVSPGTYYVKVEGWGFKKGDYTVYAHFEEPSDTRLGATSLPLGSSFAGRIGTGSDVDYFKVRVSRTGVLTVYTTGSLNTAGTLEHSDGSYLTTDDDGGDGTNFRIELFVSAGTYLVKVEGVGSNTGDYTVHAHARFEGDDHSDTRLGATSLPLGSSLAGQIANRDDVDCFEVEVSQAGVLTVYSTGNLDISGTLEDSSGNRLERDDDGGDGRNFRIERTVGAGTYYVKVAGVGSRTGDYTVHASFRGGG